MHELRHVHVSESSSNKGLFQLVGFCWVTKHFTSETKDGKNVTETEIVMTLLGKLLFTKSIQNVELLVNSIEFKISD